MRGARRLVAASVAVIAVADAVIHFRKPRWILIGVFDHPAHLATAGLIALNLPPRSRAWHAGFMAGALLPDVDHVPLALAPQHPGAGDPRPATHSLVAAIPLFAIARAARGDALTGLAWGTIAHFTRDIATGTGVPLLSPLSRGLHRVPYPLYAAVLLTLAFTALADR